MTEILLNKFQASKLSLTQFDHMSRFWDFCHKIYSSSAESMGLILTLKQFIYYFPVEKFEYINSWRSDVSSMSSKKTICFENLFFDFGAEKSICIKCASSVYLKARIWKIIKWLKKHFIKSREVLNILSASLQLLIIQAPSHENKTLLCGDYIL